MSRSHSLSLDQALGKLRKASKAASQRGNVKPHEATRITEALRLLATGLTQTPLGRKAQSTYSAFLERVNETSGIQMVVLCAFGLGKSAIGSMTETARLGLPYEIRDRYGELESEVLQKLAKGYPTKCMSFTPQPAPDVLIGRFCTDKFELTSPDSLTPETDREELAESVSARTAARPMPQDHHVSLLDDAVATDNYVALDLSVASLLKFIEMQSLGSQALQMICPLSGIPLPYIDLRSKSFVEFEGKIELSLKSSEALIRYILAADKPPE